MSNTHETKRPKLTRKQKIFVEEYIETGNGTQSALKAYDTESDNTAAQIATENLRKPQIVKALEEALPDDLLSQIHLEGLFATREIWKNNNATKRVEHVADEADFAIRAKYLDMAYKIKGHYAPEKKLNVNVEVQETDPRVIELAKKLNN